MSGSALASVLRSRSRLHAALSPPARQLSVTIRRHVPSRFRELADLADAGFLRPAAIPFLEAMVRGRLNVLVAGGTGTGKTTFARILCRLIPAAERLVTIEDQAELHLWRELPDCVSLEGRPANIEWLKDGSMLLSDDYNGAVYHITYGPRRQAGMGQ